jgi:hypothetical protein
VFKKHSPFSIRALKLKFFDGFCRIWGKQYFHKDSPACGGKSAKRAGIQMGKTEILRFF